MHWYRNSLRTGLTLGIATLAMTTGCNLLGGSLTLETPEGEDTPGWPQLNNANSENSANNAVVPPGEIDPGRVTLRRLNRTEYNNTVRDLLGVTTNPADAFPEDDFGYGFNNIGDVLSVSPLHVESYNIAAEAMVEAALDEGAPDAAIERFEAEDVGGSVGSANNGFWNLFSNGTITSVVSFPADGDYVIRVRAYQSQAGPADAQMVVAINGLPAQTFDVTNTSGDPGVFEVTATVDAGSHSVSVEFTNDFYDADIPADRNLYVDWYEVDGPYNAAGEASAMRDQILTCAPADSSAAECATEILSAFGKRAWRRPLEDGEVARLVQFVDLAEAQGDDFETGIRLALRAVLMSPNFIYRVEVDADPESTEIHALNDHELAARLSYFLWSSMPDDTLMALADQGQLSDDATLRAQVQRMLDDEKSIALVDTMMAQWLYIDAVLDKDPDYEAFPDFDEELQASMRMETRLFVKELIDTNAGLSALMTADFTYINARLATHYGVAGITGEEFVRHQWQGEGRRGLLGHGGLLTATSHPTSTSPVLRGKWVLDNILCDEPPPPPPNVENLADDAGSVEGKTLRERFEQHSEDPACATCHYQMDPIGFGMEHYDGVGAWREMDNGIAIDATGELPGDLAFNGPGELADILGAHPKLPECATEKMMTFALGRGFKRFDRPQHEVILEETSTEGHRIRDIIEAIVLSRAFRERRGGELQE